MNPKFKLKSYFKTRDTSEHGVELIRMFILPFRRLWDPDGELDASVEAFFGIEHRKIYSGTARRDFKMPGLWMKTAARAVVKSPDGIRAIVKGQKMLLIVDQKDQITRVGIEVKGKEFTFKLSRAELEFIKDYVDVKEV